MAQQMPLRSDQEEVDPQTTRQQTQAAPVGRYSETRAPNFTGGGIDPETGNLQSASSLQVARGSMPTKPEPPAPEQPQTGLGKVEPMAPPPPPQIIQVHQPAPYNPPPPPRDNGMGTIAMIGIGLLSIFCYAAGTRVRMADGSFRAIETLDIGDELDLGGKVTAIGKALCEGDLYRYAGDYVTGSHAVFEKGRFVRVGKSLYATKISHLGRTLVYPVATENRLMVLESHIAADFSETENGINQTAEQRLEELNADADRLRWIADRAAERF